MKQLYPPFISSKEIILLFFLIVALGLGIYANSLHGEFHFDDESNIIQNTRVHNLSDPLAIFQYKKSRLISYLSFALNYHFHRLEVFGYHLTNTIIHILNALLTWYFILLTFQTPGIRDDKNIEQKNLVALSTALIFLAHPLQTQAVTYITQRLTSLAAFFYLASVICYVKGRLTTVYPQKMALFLLCGLTTILGMLTKENTFTIPLAILLYEYYFFNFTMKKKAKNFYLFILLMVAGLFFIPVLFSFDFKNIFPIYESRSHEEEMIHIGNYLPTQFRVISTYLRLFFFPFGQNLLYDFSASKSFLDIKTLLCFFFLIFLILFAWGIRHKNKLVSFGITWFFLTLAVESSIIPIRYVIFEHRCYLPLVGLALITSLLLHQCLKSRKVFLITIIILTTFLSILTTQRNKVWRTDIRLWEDVVKKSPLLQAAYDNLGAAYLAKGEHQKAIAVLLKSLQLQKNSVFALNNLGSTYLALQQYDQAISYLKQGLLLEPDNVGLLNNLGTIYNIQGDQKIAEKYFKEALKINIIHPQPAMNLAAIYQKQGKFDEAINIYQQLTVFHPHVTSVYFELAKVYLEIHDQKKAIDSAKNFLQFSRDSQSLTTLATLFAEGKMVPQAMKLYIRALEIDPKNVYTYRELGKLFGNLNDFDEAIRLWRIGLQHDPDNSELKLLIQQAENLKG